MHYSELLNLYRLQMFLNKTYTIQISNILRLIIKCRIKFEVTATEVINSTYTLMINHDPKIDEFQISM